MRFDVVTGPGMWIIWMICAAVVALLWMINRNPNAEHPLAAYGIDVPLQVDPGYRRAKARSWAIVALVMCCFPAGMLLNAYSIMQNRHQSIPGWIAIFLFLGYRVMAGTMKIGGLRRIEQSVRRGDYEAALAQCDRVLRWFPGSIVYNSFRGAVLHAAGRLGEAEKSFARCLAGTRGTTPRAQALALAELAEVWLDQRRFNKAQQAFEAAKRLDEQYGPPYCGLAETYLRQGYQTEQALTLLDEGLRLKEREKDLPVRYRRMTGDIWASRADALARLGRTAEAEASLQKAEELADPACVPDMAGVLWRCGEALVHLGRESEAAAQFKRAQEIDPAGLYGKRSAAALQEVGLKV